MKAAMLLGVLLAAEALASDRTSPPPKHYRLEWSDLAPLIAGHRVALRLPGGQRVEGKVLSVEPDQMLLDITRTSDPDILPKGPAPIPREMVTEFRLTKVMDYKWRVVGTVIGGVVGAVIGGALAMLNPGAGIAFAAGSAGLGLWGGWVSDRKVTHIMVVPPPPD